MKTIRAAELEVSDIFLFSDEVYYITNVHDAEPGFIKVKVLGSVDVHNGKLTPRAGEEHRFNEEQFVFPCALKVIT